MRVKKKKKKVLDQVRTVFDRDVWVLVFEHVPLSSFALTTVPLQGLVKIDKINKQINN